MDINNEDKKSKQKIKNDKRRNHNRSYIIEYLNIHPCVKCGEKNPIVLEFHHIRDKDKKISDLINYSHNRLKKEIEKCQVLCSNCHKIITASQQNWYKLKQRNDK